MVAVAAAAVVVVVVAAVVAVVAVCYSEVVSEMRTTHEGAQNCVCVCV